MRYKTIFYINGILLLILSGAMLIPALVDLAHQSADWKVFAGSQIFTGFMGFALIFMNRQEKFQMSLRETFLLASISWVLIACFGALPFYFSELSIPFSKAYFESMSGLTTTGATVLSGLDYLPKGLLLWRAMLQWLGGIGFLIIALAILPLLQISGMQIFKAQSFGIEKIMPSASQLALYICLIYTGLTLICTGALYAAGMTFFEAICHALTTLATGGFSTSDSSVGYFRSDLIEWIIIFFMICGGIPFVLYIRALRGDILSIFKDSQVRAFLRILFVLSCTVALYLIVTDQQFFFDAVRNALFMVTALTTTTGYANADYTLWGPFIVGIAFLATFLGACSGSTSGGMKVFRLQILWSSVVQHIRQLITPHGVFKGRYNGKPIDDSIQASVTVFFFVHALTWVALSIFLLLTGLDFITAISGAVSAVSNVGPALGNFIGPAGNFSMLSDPALWSLSLGMLLGRMEFLTFLVLLAPRFWRD